MRLAVLLFATVLTIAIGTEALAQEGPPGTAADRWKDVPSPKAPEWKNPDGPTGTYWLDLDGAFGAHGEVKTDPEVEGASDPFHRTAFALGFGYVAGRDMTLRLGGSYVRTNEEDAYVVGQYTTYDQVVSLFSVNASVRIYLNLPR